MKRAILFVFALAAVPASLFCDNRHIAFERDQTVWIANLDGTAEKKIADGIFPAISPDGTRVAFNTTEKTSDTTYARHIAVIDVATGKIDVFQDERRNNYLARTAFGSTTTTFFFSAAPPAKRKIRFIECPPTGKISNA
jgi:hypothetical protein